MGSPAIPYLQVVKGLRDLLFEFWNPSISRERLELETLHFASRLTTRSINGKKCKIRSKRIEKGSRDLLKFWTLHISRTVGARNFKFGASMQNTNTRDDQ